MIEVFTTDIPNQRLGKKMIKKLKETNAALEIDFDIEGSVLTYPFDHSILRIEGPMVNALQIISIVNKNGYKCDILEDTIKPQSYE